MASVVKCFAIDGIDGYPVDIEIKNTGRTANDFDYRAGRPGSERGIGTCTGGN